MDINTTRLKAEVIGFMQIAKQQRRKRERLKQKARKKWVQAKWVLRGKPKGDQAFKDHKGIVNRVNRFDPVKHRHHSRHLHLAHAFGRGRSYERVECERTHEPPKDRLIYEILRPLVYKSHHQKLQSEIVKWLIPGLAAQVDYKRKKQAATFMQLQEAA